jgi:hypothetical protein
MRLLLCKRNIRHYHFSDERHRDSPATAPTDCMESQSSHSPCPRHLPLHGDLTNTIILQAILPRWQNKRASKPCATALRKVYRPDVIRQKADAVLIWGSWRDCHAICHRLLYHYSFSRRATGVGVFLGGEKKLMRGTAKYLPRLGNANSIKRASVFSGDSTKPVSCCVVSLR